MNTDERRWKNKKVIGVDLRLSAARNGFFQAERGNILMRIEKLIRRGKEFAVIPVKDLQKLMDDAEMLADVKAYDAAKSRLDRGDDELVPLTITERRLAG